jgi:hypothetical protein
MELAKQCGRTLEELRNTMSYAEMKLWLAARLIEQDRIKKQQLQDEVDRDFRRNKGKFK